MKFHPDYELFEEIGRGQGTIVHRAHDLTLGRDVAIKTLIDEVAGQDPERKGHFLREAQFLAQYEHENILRIYSVDSERTWIIMELMQATLASQVTRQAMDFQAVRSVLRQALRALDFLHRKQKIHAAIRPSNLLINDEGLVKLSDFEETHENSELTVPLDGGKYLAPELLRDDQGAIRPSLDLYNLGFTALELLTGPRFDSLFSGTGQDAIDANTAWMRWHNSDEKLAPVAQLVDGIPADIASLVDLLICKPVVDRPESAEDALKLLDTHPITPVVIDTAVQNAKYVADVRKISSPMSGVSGAIANDEAPAAPRTSVKKSQKFSFNAADLLTLLKSHRRWIAPTMAAFLLLIGAVAALNAMGRNNNERESSVVMPTPTVATSTPTVTVVVNPADASVTLNDLPVKTAEGVARPEVIAGTDIVIRAEYADYLPFEKTMAWEQLQQSNFVVKIDLEPPKPQLPEETGVAPVLPVANDTLTKTNPAPENEPPPLAPETHSTWLLPEQLVIKPGSKLDPEYQLPMRAVSARLPESVSMEFMLVKPEKFLVGTNSSGKFRWELSQSEFVLERPFYIAIHETSIAQYAIFNESEGEMSAGVGWIEAAQKWNVQHPEDRRTSGLPASNMTAAQAERFCEWLGGRLPQEFEWEAAATNSQRSADEGLRQRHLFRGQLEFPVPVSESASTSELIHPLGNIAEWCRLQEPQMHKGKQMINIAKGCSFLTPPGRHVRLAWRSFPDDERELDIGIRVLIPVNQR